MAGTGKHGVQPHRIGCGRPGQSAGIGRTGTGTLGHDGAVGVIDQQLRLASDHESGIVGIGTDTLARTADRAAHHFLTHGPTFGVIAAE